MLHAHLQSFARAVCLIWDMLLFIVTFRHTRCSVFTTAIKTYGSDILPNIISVQFCDFCSSAAFTVSHLCLHSRLSQCESERKSPLPHALTSFSSFCGRQGSYQGPGISQASTMATTVPYSQPIGNSSSATGNAQGPAYNLPPSGKRSYDPISTCLSCLAMYRIVAKIENEQSQPSTLMFDSIYVTYSVYRHSYPVVNSAYNATSRIILVLTPTLRT